MLRSLLFVFLLACINQSINGQATENDQVLAIIGSTLSPHIVFNGHFTTNPASQVGGTTNYLWMLQDSRDDAPTQALHKGIVKFDGTTNQYIDLSAVTGANSCGQRVGTFGGVNPAVPADRVGASFEIVVKFDAIANWAKAFDLSTAAGIDSMTLTWDGSSDNLGRILVEQYVNVTTIRSINWDKANMEWFRPTLSEWYHLAIVQKPAVTVPGQAGYGSGYWYLYINGQLWALADKISPGASLTPTQTANYPQRVTRNSQWLAKSSWADPNMAMTVDAFRVYDFALTTSEVSQLAAIYGLNKSSYALPTPALNQPMPTDYPEANKHRTSHINFDPFFKVDFATNPRSYVGGALNYEWLQVNPADSAADQAQHTGILRTNGEPSSYVDLMAATGPNSAGKVMPTLFDGSSGSGDAYGWSIDIVVKPLGPITSQVWSKFFSLGSGPDVDAIFMGWVADSNSFEVGNYINARDDLKFDRLGYMTFYRAPTLNRWTHLTVVMQPKNPGPQPMSSYNATWTIYVDGQMVGRNNLTTNYPTPVVRRYSALARSNWQLDANIRMEMDVFRVWDRALDANQVESLAVAYGIDAVDGGDWAWKQALGTARAPRYNLDFQYHPSQNGGGPTGWTWSEQDPTDATVIAGQHTGLCILDGSATSFVDLDATTGPNRVYDNLVMPMVGGPTAPGNNLIAGWTIELVFKATNWNSWAKIISLSNRQDEDEIMIGFDQEDGNMIVQNYITDNVYNAWAYAAVEVMKPTQLNKWYHLVVTMRPGSVPGAGNWQIYVNGQLQNWADRLMAGMTFTEGQGASYPRGVDRPNAFLGKSNWPNDANMRVIIDAFRIYDYVITQEQVTAFASAYGCNERVHINSPADNVNLPVTTETNNWRAAGIATPPIFNAIFPNDPATFNQNNGVTDFKWLQSDPNDPPEVAAFHQGVIVFNGSGSCWADLNQVRGPKTIGLVAPIIGGVGSGTGSTRGVTFELVVKLTSVLGWGKLFMLASGPNLDAYSMGWNGNNYDTIETQNWNSIKSGLVQKGAVQILASPPLNRWMHIVVVLQLTDDTKWEGLWTAYVDGEVVARKTATETPFPANFPLPIYRQHSTIAKSAWPGDPTAVMVLDMMRIHDYCLTQDQIRGTARQYGLYGDSRPNPAPTNVTRQFPDTAESTAARSAVSRAPVFNAWFGTNPQPTVAPSATLGYTWVERDDTDTPADQGFHRGIVKFNGASSSFIDMTTNTGINSCGVVLPMIGGPGSGSASDKTQGWTFEIVFKITRMDSWAKLFNIGGGAEIAVIGLGVDGSDRTTMNAEVFDRLQTSWPHGFTEYMTPVMGKWYHAVWQIAPVNMTSGSAMWYFYVNGQLLNWSEQLATKTSFTPVQGANYPRYTERRFSYIGKSNWAADPFFAGAVDAMRVYDYLLTEKQITDLAKQYGCYDTSLMINTPAQNSALVNPENQAEVKVWDREGISAPVFNGNFAVDPRLHLGGALSSYQYTWMETDPLDTPADKNAHKGLLYIDGTPSQFIDLMRPSGPNSVGLVIPTLFGRGSGEGNQRGWTVELVFKCQRAETWSKFVNLATGGGDFFDSWAVSWFGDVRGTWMIQNYNNYNPIPGQLVEKGAMKFLNTPEIGRWYHLTAVMQPLPPYSRWGAVWRVYLDGTLVNRTTTENFPMPVVRDNSAIGRSQWGDQDPNSRMTVDALRIYDKALTPTQVAALARAYGVASPTVIGEPDLPVDPNDFGGGQGGGGGNDGGNPSPSGGSTSNSSLGGGAIAGIVIGCVVGAAVLCALVFCFCLPGVRSGKKHIDSDGHKNTASYDEMEASRQSQMDHDEVEMGETA